MENAHQYQAYQGGMREEGTLLLLNKMFLHFHFVNIDHDIHKVIM